MPPSPSDGRRATGARGEEIAARYLSSRGWEILARSWRPEFAPRLGEVDLLARDGSTLVVVEVRARSSRGHGTSLESVDARKAARLARLARAAARAFDMDEVRVDVVGIDRGRGRATRLTYVPNAVEIR